MLSANGFRMENFRLAPRQPYEKSANTLPNRYCRRVVGSAQCKRFASGSVVTINIEPDYEFNDRSGMSTSSRKKAIELWQVDIPAGDRETLAKTLFCFENPPGTKYVSGSQDSLGNCSSRTQQAILRGRILAFEYRKNTSEETLSWLEKGFGSFRSILERKLRCFGQSTNITPEHAKSLATAAQNAWTAIQEQDVKMLGKAVREALKRKSTCIRTWWINKFLPYFLNIKTKHLDGSSVAQEVEDILFL